MGGRPKTGHADNVRCDLLENLQSLPVSLARRFKSEARHISARMGKTLHQSNVDRHADRVEYRGHLGRDFFAAVAPRVPPTTSTSISGSSAATAFSAISG